jgi:hypothetical protein
MTDVVLSPDVHDPSTSRQASSGAAYTLERDMRLSRMGYFASPMRRSSSSERLRLTLSRRPPLSCTV